MNFPDFATSYTTSPTCPFLTCDRFTATPGIICQSENENLKCEVFHSYVHWASRIIRPQVSCHRRSALALLLLYLPLHSVVDSRYGRCGMCERMMKGRRKKEWGKQNRPEAAEILIDSPRRSEFSLTLFLSTNSGFLIVTICTMAVPTFDSFFLSPFIALPC